MQTRPVIAAAVVALGLAAAGWFASQGMTKLRTADRYVTVKGSAEKIVDADLVVWPLSQKKRMDADNNSESRLRQGGMRLMASGRYSGSGDIRLRVRGGQGLPWLATLLHDKPVIRCRAQSAGE